MAVHPQRPPSASAGVVVLDAAGARALRASWPRPDRLRSQHWRLKLGNELAPHHGHERFSRDGLELGAFLIGGPPGVLFTRNTPAERAQQMVTRCSPDKASIHHDRSPLLANVCSQFRGRQVSADVSII